MEVRIISTPPGEAPEDVRKAWVGLVLPLAVSGAQTRQTVGVLSRPKTFLGLLLALLLGRTERQRGYVVDAYRAIEILAKSAPDAARWWRDNAAASIRPGKRFLFSAEACQEVS
jgi:hypothetical protein